MIFWKFNGFLVYFLHVVLMNFIGNVFLLAEQTFIVLDKELIIGKFIPGEPHVEGCISSLILNYH